jgi:hypothetical protein
MTESTDTCNAETREDGLCELPAGWGTDHSGQGRCKLHGGASPVKHGLYSKYSNHRLSEKIEKLKDADDLLDLRNTVALQQSLILDLMDDTDELDADTAEVLNRIAESLSRTRKRLATIEDGLTVNVNDIRTLVERVVVVVQEETDSQTAERIGQRILQEGEVNNGKLE